MRPGQWVARYINPLEEGVRRLTSEPARFLNQPRKGRIAAGLDADLVIFDPETIGPQPPEWVNDLPGEKPRLIERATGVQHTIVGGNIVFSDNVHQGGLPGTLLRPV